MLVCITSDGRRRQLTSPGAALLCSTNDSCSCVSNLEMARRGRRLPVDRAPPVAGGEWSVRAPYGAHRLRLPSDWTSHGVRDRACTELSDLMLLRKCRTTNGQADRRQYTLLTRAICSAQCAPGSASRLTEHACASCPATAPCQSCIDCSALAPNCALNCCHGQVPKTCTNGIDSALVVSVGTHMQSCQQAWFCGGGVIQHPACLCCSSTVHARQPRCGIV